MAACDWQGPTCEGDDATGHAKYWTWHDRYRLVAACATCLEHERRRQEDGPADDALMNGHGIEGGIPYQMPIERRR